MSLLKLTKFTPANLDQEHKNLIKNINAAIYKRQKTLLIDSELTYFT
jgi:hypothetical protein